MIRKFAMWVNPDHPIPLFVLIWFLVYMTAAAGVISFLVWL